MPVGAHAQRFLDIVAGAPPLDTLTAEQNREDLNAALALIGDPTPVHEVRDASVGAVPVRIYRPTDDAALPAVVYLHGGGWVLGGGLALFDTVCRDLAVHAGAAVVAIDYRVAPEHPFPAALEDAMTVLSAVLGGASDLGVDPDRVAVVGDSAGGNLAAVCAQQLRAHTPALRHQALIYPVTDARVGATPSYAEFGVGHFLTERDMRYFVDQYAAGVDVTDPRLSPAAAEDLGGVAAATVVTAECDPLRDEGEAYAAALEAAGVPTLLRRFDGMVHPFVVLGGIVPEALEARRFLGLRLREAWEPGLI